MNHSVSYRSLLRANDFRWLWVGQVISSLGNNFTYLALSVLAYQVTGAALSVGLMLAANALPFLLVRPLAGVLVDRWDRRRIMIVSDLIRALLIAAVPSLVRIHLGWAYVLAFLSSTVAQFFNPALLSVIPELVNEGELMAANALYRSSQKLTEVAGFALAGWMATTIALPLVFYLDSLTFLISAMSLSMIAVSSPISSKPLTARNVYENLLEGLRFIRQEVVLAANLAVAGVAPIPLGMITALLLVFTVQALKSDALGYGVLESTMGLGIVLGSLVLGKLGARYTPGRLLGGGLAGMGVATLMLSQLDHLVPALGLVFLFGMLNVAPDLVPLWMVQRHTPSEFRGRVLSVWGLVIQGAFLVGMMVGSVLADAFGVRYVLAGAGVFLMVIGMTVEAITGPLRLFILCAVSCSRSRFRL